MEDAFEDAYKNSLEKSRKFHPNFLRYDDEVSKLLTDDFLLRKDYQQHYRKLIENIPGQLKDRRMAALVLHLHPELKVEYNHKYVNDLSPEQEFGISMPETSEESRQRIGQSNASESFAETVEKLKTDTICL